ncbi:CLUMA_CG002226, isoform A [Clunio marinus]|uniref:U3 small nucleolar RNA-associated protein 15 homolog n=1 Tax=Clunio marinus TaxID=568069 RepID=A0A1J1HK55_9DIPT|nr:CLUMA_CG002226, isoform A [Clunio marinus]
MNSFKKTPIQVFTKGANITSEECNYWKQLDNQSIIKEFGAIDYIDFCSLPPFNFAATCSVRVQIYNPLTKLVLKNISTFQKQAYGATFRKDGLLLCAGDEDGSVRLFDANTKTVLRIFKGHSAPVHRTFFTNDNLHLTSFSDDKSVRIWDIATEKETNIFQHHEDYIRAGVVHPTSDNTIASGSYDNTIKIYDTRLDKCVMTMDHNSPLESLVFLPSGGILISAGGNDIKVWDVVSGGRQLATITKHTKAVTCLQVTSNGQHLISGSLDRHVKFFNTLNYQMVHSQDYTNSILSLGISKDNNCLAVGQVDGTLVVNQREHKYEETRVEKLREKRREKRNNRLADEVVEVFKLEKQSKHDALLRKFEYSKALDSVLTRYCVNKTPQVTVAVMHELLRRQGLVSAFSNRSQESLAKIITFFNKYISDSRFSITLTDIINVFLDCYQKSFLTLTSDIQQLIIELSRRVKIEEQLTFEFLEIGGALDMLINASTDVIADRGDSRDPSSKLHPSDNAKTASIINVNA